MGHIPLVKTLQGSCEDIYFLHVLSPFLNHTFYIERFSLSRAVKKMTQLYKAYTDVSCTAVCNLLTYLRSWALLEKPPIMQPLKNFPAFYGTRRFITVFTRALPHFRLLKLYLMNITSPLPAKILIETFEYYYYYYKHFISLECAI
jgi:hypothetical protein